MPKRLQQLCYATLLLLLTACGGGDGGGGGGGGTVTPPPTVSNDSAGTDEDTPVEINVLANDTNVQSSGLQITDAPDHGTTSIQNGTVTYTPAENYHGTDQFTYSVTANNGSNVSANVTITINPVNDPPIANPDQAAIAAGSSIQIDVLANDSDVDGTLGAITLASEPAHGSAVIDDGTILYTADISFVGSDTFSYRVVDDENDSSNEATIRVEVSPPLEPVANDDSASTDEDTAVEINVLANDSDFTSGSLQIAQNPANGSATIRNSAVTYTPNANFNGSDAFIYQVQGIGGVTTTANVSVTVNDINDQPLAFADAVTTSTDQPVQIQPLSNDSDIDGSLSSIVITRQPANGTTTVQGNTIEYTANDSFTGTDTLAYQAVDDDGDASNEAIITVTVTLTEPVANDDTAVTDEDNAVIVDVLANDINIDLASLQISLNPTNGSVVIADGKITFTPNANFNGIDTFIYQVQGLDGIPISANVTVTVNDVNDAPVATPDQVFITNDQIVQIAVLQNDSDPDGTLDFISITVQAGHGTATVQGDQIVYTPDPLFTGSDSLSYQVSDDDGSASNVVTVSIQITQPTILTVSELTVPIANYNSLFSNELNRQVLVSDDQAVPLPADLVSFVLQLTGTGVELDSDGLAFNTLADPSGIELSPLYRNGAFCASGYCSILVPQKPAIIPEDGTWQYALAALTSNLGTIDFSDAKLRIAYRTGSKPNLAAPFPASLTIKPFLTGTAVTEDDLAPVITYLENLLNDSNIAVTMEPLTVIENLAFAEVADDFFDPVTAELVTMGDADKVNIFFIEGFTDPGKLGIASGIPGTLGVKGPLNGILINAAATHEGHPSVFARSTAEVAFHELGHFLGLFHTTEKDFSSHDILDDTGACIDDLDNNGIADSSECPDGTNPMFWDPDLLITRDGLTDQQKQVLFYSPIAK